jgi:hypothetical protein
LDEDGDFGRFSVKKRPVLFSLFGLADERASSARFVHAMARRIGLRRAAAELSTAVDTLNDTRSRDSARIEHLQLATGAMSGTAAESREISPPRVWFRICAFHRETPINGVRKRAFVAVACLVACFGGFWLVRHFSEKKRPKNIIRALRQQRPHDTRFRGVSSWTLQLGFLWGSKWGVSCRVFIVKDLKYKTDTYALHNN